MEDNKLLDKIDDGAIKKSAKGMAMYGKKAKMDEKNDPDNDDITIDPDTNFKLDLKHLLQVSPVHSF